MTDEEAKVVLQRLHGLPCSSTDEALLHALQAIEDRAAIVAVWRTGDMTCSQGAVYSAVDAARRHMRGEP